MTSAIFLLFVWSPAIGEFVAWGADVEISALGKVAGRRFYARFSAVLL